MLINADGPLIRIKWSMKKNRGIAICFEKSPFSSAVRLPLALSRHSDSFIVELKMQAKRYEHKEKEWKRFFSLFSVLLQKQGIVDKTKWIPCSLFRFFIDVGVDVVIPCWQQQMEWYLYRQKHTHTHPSARIETLFFKCRMVNAVVCAQTAVLDS